MNIHLPQWLSEADTRLLLAINGANSATADSFWFWAANKWTWIPFYAILLLLLFRRFRKQILLLLPLTAAMIACSDQLSSLMKATTERLRPCHDPSLQALIHTVNDRCGGMYGFVSSHAANTMALAVFIVLITNGRKAYLAAALCCYVVINGYSRIYLGAHFPVDVVGGWMIGAIIGMIFSTFVLNILSRTDAYKTELK